MSILSSVFHCHFNASLYTFHCISRNGTLIKYTAQRLRVNLPFQSSCAAFIVITITMSRRLWHLKNLSPESNDLDSGDAMMTTLPPTLVDNNKLST